ncbi:Cytoplasmic phosphatidylinositol transfer protein 1 [Willisornis vidua]|uniref:Cytoplasmic phosphatidylinositol transfer protein 1 n=1 Tax=Willisornis vidua TaxID=1566151 RepID=A0ABQ9DLK3_9PASS|nr:Cytoplasmic phosphatidylinositol transfer protein 1 [Willisornis vidua]
MLMKEYRICMPLTVEEKSHNMNEKVFGLWWCVVVTNTTVLFNSFLEDNLAQEAKWSVNSVSQAPVPDLLQSEFVGQKNIGKLDPSLAFIAVNESLFLLAVLGMGRFVSEGIDVVEVISMYMPKEIALQVEKTGQVQRQFAVRTLVSSRMGKGLESKISDQKMNGKVQFYSKIFVMKYRIGQLYMISKHSHEQSDRGEGVEVVQNEPFEDPNHGNGQLTEKRNCQFRGTQNPEDVQKPSSGSEWFLAEQAKGLLAKGGYKEWQRSPECPTELDGNHDPPAPDLLLESGKLPSWARAVVPKIFYVTEKAWNYYPYTITEQDSKAERVTAVHVSDLEESVNNRLNLADCLKCSFLPKFSIHIETKYEDNKGSNDSIFDKEAKDLEREVCFIDIASDEIPERYYKESEDPKYFKSQKTGRGQLKEGWRETHQPIMCSYKLVTVKFEVWGLQTRVEQFVHKVVRDILLIGHRQAFAWVDEWYDMTMDDVREYEKNMHEKTNIKVCNQHSSAVDEIESHAKARM